MEMNIAENIENKNYKNFESFFESDEFSSINNNEYKRQLFYYYALKFSSEENKNINQLYKDLKEIIEKMDKNDYLQKYDEELYINIIINYLEKIELFITKNNFFKKKENEKEKEQENYNSLRDIIKLFYNHLKQKEKCPKEIFNNLEELYDILKIKMKYKIPDNYHKRMNRHLD